jgi:arylsulfatase A-like enzyme
VTRSRARGCARARRPRSPRRIRLRGAALAGLLALAAACARDEAPRRPPRLVVLYAACTLARDQLSPWAPEVRFTPNLQRFAEGGLVFRRHVTEAEQSGITYASLFTGCQADCHGVYRHPSVLNGALYQISEAFRDAGFETWFWSGQRMGGAEYGYGQGVAPRRSLLRVPEDRLSYTANDGDFAALLERLERDPDYRAFVQIGLTLTHSPYHHYATPEVVEAFRARFPEADPGLAPEDHARLLALYDRYRLALQWNYPETVERLRRHEDPAQRLRDGDEAKLAALLELLYRAAVWQLDGLFGQWLDAIEARGLLDESLIAFTADHGELLHRENALFKWTHGLELAPEVLTVPLVLRGAGVAPGHYDGVTRSIDVFPMLAGLSGVAIPEGAQVEGVDLSRAVRGEEEPPELVAFFHTSTLGPNLLEQFAGDRDLTGDGRIDAGPLTPYTQVLRRVPREDVAFVWVGSRRGDAVFKKTFDGSSWRFEAYDLAADPHETRDLFDPADPEHRRRAGELDAYQARLLRGPYSRTRLSAEDIEKLTALGYLGGEPPAAPAPPP